MGKGGGGVLGVVEGGEGGHARRLVQLIPRIILDDERKLAQHNIQFHV